MRTMTLGEMINTLKRKEPKAQVVFDFCGMKPTTLASWRGVYAQLALGWSPTDAAPDITVAELLVALEDAVGKVYTGYKGGEYTMWENTPVWCDQYGRYTRTAIVDISDVDGYVILKTAHAGF